MKPFHLVPTIAEYPDFASFAAAEALGAQDLILTNEYIYAPVIESLGLGCQTLFQEKFGGGEPTDTMVDAILHELSGRSFRRIVAVGGGTIIDIAKVLCVAEPGAVADDLYAKMPELQKHHELIIVPTTCGTGSEVTNISIINRTRLGVKQGLVSMQMYADQAALISQMLMSLPYGVFATSSIDAMIHAVESYLSPNGCAISELFAEKALHVILRAWQEAVKQGGGDSWKQSAAELLRASDFAGIAFGYAGCAAVHALSYPLGGTYHVAHGESNQAMFAGVMQMYAQKAPHGKLEQLEALLASILNVRADVSMQALYTLMEDILPRKPLHQYGVKPEGLEVFTDNVLQTQQRLLGNNYVPLDRQEILEIYRSVY